MIEGLPFHVYSLFNEDLTSSNIHCLTMTYSASLRLSAVVRSRSFAQDVASNRDWALM